MCSRPCDPHAHRLEHLILIHLQHVLHVAWLVEMKSGCGCASASRSARNSGPRRQLGPRKPAITGPGPCGRLPGPLRSRPGSRPGSRPRCSRRRGAIVCSAISSFSPGSREIPVMLAVPQCRVEDDHLVAHRSLHVEAHPRPSPTVSRHCPATGPGQQKLLAEGAEALASAGGRSRQVRRRTG